MGWAMVGRMTGPWRTPQGSIALVGVMGLVLLSLVLAGASCKVSCGASTVTQSSASGPVWEPGGWDADLTGLPPQAGDARAHQVLSLRPLTRGELAHLVLLPSPGSDADALREPQQLAHRITGSRSPPLI
ncbi:hypothetical protein ABT352_23665 [Streptosporangium sp. NPDC000563]|uniref:hypothetical protein n=2 Tax=unclassified Streptosporangium TaxID=2632669 RepID=UPI00332993EB